MEAETGNGARFRKPGMKIPAKLFLPRDGVERRGRPRHVLRLDVSIAVGQHGSDALVHDLSTTGFRIETDDRLTIGETLTIALPDNSTAEAEVIWNRDRSYGCRFTQAVTQAAIGAIVLQAPIDLPATVPAQSVIEVELGSGLDILQLADWYQDFQKRRSSSGEQLIGFRKVDDRIVALISRLS